MSTPQSAAFTKAIADSRKLKAKPTNDELLELYALFKQGTQQPAFEQAEKPSTWAFEAKYKYNAWKKVVDEKVTPKDAQTKYVALVEKLKGQYGFDANKEPEGGKKELKK